ncbi:MAG: tRNA (adenosine(37)-N6)-threonylcarbamoyltransferase complex ATPase subunit type 1 TsaE [Gammaproteobacteria bacterium]|nr:tRNA (adenosine(37)-N6)-threonylcarbamoyltransferase complex ATPase subunit type 1 TsaE [Gammaproteobacteria bacterium]
MLSLELRGETAQVAFGSKLAECCPAPCVIHLQGDLGAGKTTLVRGFLRGLGYRGNVKSPTYTLLEPYELQACNCYHFDLYRLADPDELEYLGIPDLLDGRAILLVEWPERGGGLLPAADLLIDLRHVGRARRLALMGKTPVGERIIRQMQGFKPSDFVG